MTPEVMARLLELESVVLDKRAPQGPAGAQAGSTQPRDPDAPQRRVRFAESPAEPPAQAPALPASQPSGSQPPKRRRSHTVVEGF